MAGSAGFGAKGFEGGQAGGGEEPAGEWGVGMEGGGLAGEAEEDFLGDVFGEVGIFDVAAGDGVDEVDVGGDDLREELRRGGALVSGEEVAVVHVGCSVGFQEDICRREVGGDMAGLSLIRWAGRCGD